MRLRVGARNDGVVARMTGDRKLELWDEVFREIADQVRNDEALFAVV